MHNILGAKAQIFYHPNQCKLGPRDHIPHAGPFCCHDQLYTMTVRYAHGRLLAAMPMEWSLLIIRFLIPGRQRSYKCHDIFEHLGGRTNA